MAFPAIDFSSLRKVLSQLEEALRFGHDLRSAVIQSFEFPYELSVRMLRRMLVERAAAADLITDLSFNDLLRRAADAGFLADPLRWRRWREMRNATSHAYDEERAEQLAQGPDEFLADALALLHRLESSLEP